MKNEERIRRGISDSDICPLCNQQQESLIHSLRDCGFASDIWNKFVGEEEWSRFFSLCSSQWLETNLKNVDFGSGQWQWPNVFVVVVYMIW